MFLKTEALIWILPTIAVVLGAFGYAVKTRKDLVTQLSGLHSNASPTRRRILTAVLLGAFILTALTLIRPYGGTILSEHRKPTKNLIFLLDVSKSMSASDAEGLTRLNAAKLYAREIIDSRPSDRIGLISFSGAPFPECPTTLERTMLLSRLNILEPGSIPVGGTDFAAALDSANTLLTENPPPGSAIIVLSDGDNVSNNPDASIKALSEKDIPIFTIVLGNTKTEASLPNSPLRSRANDKPLRSMAQETLGGFFTGKPADLDETVSKLNARIDAIELFGGDIAPEIYNRPLELYAYPLSIALVLLLIHLFLPLRGKKWRPLTASFAFFFLEPHFTGSQCYAQEEAASYEKLAGYSDARKLSEEEEIPLVIHFTGSDWSPLSLTFEREILNHSSYQKWERAKVISRTIDLPRAGISAERRNAHRFMAKKFKVTSFPTSIFLEPGSENVLGQLTHDPAGPASWIRRANEILGGNKAVSDSPNSLDHLPAEVQQDLTDPGLTGNQRSVRLFNQAMQLERNEPDLSLISRDRFELLLDLYDQSYAEADVDRPDLQFRALYQQAILHHQKARFMVPDFPDDAASEAVRKHLANSIAKRGIEKQLKRAIALYEKSLEFYRETVPLFPNHETLPENLAMAYRDLARTKAYLTYHQAYTSAVKHTMEALVQETAFRRSLDQEVTTRQEINREKISKSTTAITDLIYAAEVIQDQPTLLDLEKFPEFQLALEDIELAPAPHKIRDLHPSTQHIKNALEHLIDPQQMQQGQGQGQDQDQEENEGEKQAEPDKGTPDDLEQQQAPEDKADREADLRRAQKNQGSLRDRLLEGLEKKYRRVPRSMDK